MLDFVNDSSPTLSLNPRTVFKLKTNCKTRNLVDAKNHSKEDDVTANKFNCSKPELGGGDDVANHYDNVTNNAYCSLPTLLIPLGLCGRWLITTYDPIKIWNPEI